MEEIQEKSHQAPHFKKHSQECFLCADEDENPFEGSSEERAECGVLLRKARRMCVFYCIVWLKVKLQNCHAELVSASYQLGVFTAFRQDPEG